MFNWASLEYGLFCISDDFGKTSVVSLDSIDWIFGGPVVALDGGSALEVEVETSDISGDPFDAVDVIDVFLKRILLIQPFQIRNPHHKNIHDNFENSAHTYSYHYLFARILLDVIRILCVDSVLLHKLLNIAKI